MNWKNYLESIKDNILPVLRFVNDSADVKIEPQKFIVLINDEIEMEISFDDTYTDIEIHDNNSEDWVKNIVLPEFWKYFVGFPDGYFDNIKPKSVPIRIIKMKESE